MSTISRSQRLALPLALFAALLLLVPAAFAAKGGGGGGGGGGGKPGGGGGGTGGSGSFSLVKLDSTDGLVHWGQQITFTVSTTATAEPHVSVTCSQNGAVVYGAATGFYASYPWPWTQVMTLSSGSWTGGAASCKASLYYFSGTSTITLGSMSFSVYA